MLVMNFHLYIKFEMWERSWVKHILVTQLFEIFHSGLIPVQQANGSWLPLVARCSVMTCPYELSMVAN